MFLDDLFLLCEDAARDVAEHAKADAIRAALYRFLLNADPDDHYGFRAYRFSDGDACLTLRGSDLGLAGEDARLWFRFMPQDGWFPSGHYSRFVKSGDPVITVKCLQGEATDIDAARNHILHFIPVQTILLHELIHYEDHKRMTHDQLHGTSGLPDDAYYNDPVEFNAYFHNIAEPFFLLLNAARRGADASLLRLAKGLRIGRDFNANLAELTRRAAGQSALTKFLKTLSPARRRSFLRRLYKLHQQVVAALDKADEPGP